MISTIIVEDEKRNARVLRNLIQEVSSGINILATVHSIETALEVIPQLQPQLVFLDIQMPHGTGFDLLDQLETINFEIIFTTAFDNYAIQAIKFSALDYLLKPIDKAELSQAIQKVLNKQSSHQQRQNIELLLKSLNGRMDPAIPFEKIALPTLKGYRFVLIKDILYCEADGTYCKIYLNGQAIIVSRNLKEIEGLLREHPFFRVHRSYLINMNHVTEYIKGDGGQVYLSNGTMVPVSQRRRELFVKHFFSKLH